MCVHMHTESGTLVCWFIYLVPILGLFFLNFHAVSVGTEGFAYWLLASNPRDHSAEMSFEPLKKMRHRFWVYILPFSSLVHAHVCICASVHTHKLWPTCYGTRKGPRTAVRRRSSLHGVQGWTQYQVCVVNTSPFWAIPLALFCH